MAAYRESEPYRESQRRKVWKIIRAHPQGLACWEVEEYIKQHGGMGLHQSVSATINWLFNEGWVIRVGVNKTPANRRAYVYEAVTKKAKP
jgi:hypothetical protein